MTCYIIGDGAVNFIFTRTMLLLGNGKIFLTFSSVVSRLKMMIIVR